jgi:hypothetical protein
VPEIGQEKIDINSFGTENKPKNSDARFDASRIDLSGFKRDSRENKPKNSDARFDTSRIDLSGFKRDSQENKPKNSDARFDASRIDLSGFKRDSQDLQKTKMRANLIGAAKTDQKSHLENYKLSQETGVPMSAVATDPKKIKSSLDLSKIDIDSLVKNNPVTSRFIARDFDNTVFAQEDISEGILQAVEDAVVSTLDVVRAPFSGVFGGLGTTLEGFAETIDVGSRFTARGLDAILPESFDKFLYASETPSEFDRIATMLLPQTFLRFQGQGLKQISRSIGAPQERQNIATDIGFAFGQVVQQIALAMVNPTLAFSSLFAQGVDQQATRQKASGTKGQNVESDLALLTGGAITLGIEPIGLSAILNRIPVKVKNDTALWLTDLVISGGIEAAQEAAENIAHGVLELYTTNPDAEIFQGLEREAIAAGGAGALARGILNLLNPIPLRMRGARQEAAYQEDVGDFEQTKIDTLSANSELSKLRRENPEIFKQFVSEADGGASTHVYFDGAQTVLYLRGKTTQEIEADKALTTLNNAVEESRATGTDVAISIESFAGDIVGSKVFTDLRPHMTLSSETVSQFRKKRHKKETNEYMNELEQVALKKQKQENDAKLIYEEIKGQIIQTRTVSPKVAAQLAEFVPKWAISVARRSRKSVLQVYRDSGLKVEGFVQSESPIISQTPPTPTATPESDLTPTATPESDLTQTAPPLDEINGQIIPTDNAPKIEIETPKNETENEKRIDQVSSDSVDAKGYYDPSSSVIRLNKSADISTFIHEFTHFMYEMEVRGKTDLNTEINQWFVRNIQDVTSEATEEFNRSRKGKSIQFITKPDVLKYIEGGATGNSKKDRAIRTTMHEQMARGFETFVMEGKAPSSEIRKAFRAISRLLVQVYRSIKGDLNVNLDDQIRGVMGRLVATDEQINAAKERARILPMFTDSVMASMTPEQYQTYQEQVETVDDVANETVREKLIKDLTRKAQSWWGVEKETFVSEEAEKLSAKRVYSTIKELKQSKIKLVRSVVKELVGENATDSSGRQFLRLPDILRGMTSQRSDAMHPDEASGLFGYSSGHEMLLDMANALPLKDASDINAEGRMVEKYGDILADGTIENLADEAIRSEARGKLIFKEFKVVSKSSSARSLQLKEIKDIAKERIENLSFREIQPQKYRKAEILAAQEATRLFIGGDNEGALRAKMRQLINFYLGKEATNARIDIIKRVENMARYRKRSVIRDIQKARGGYWEQIEKILERFEFKKTASLKSVDAKNESLETWSQKMIDGEGAGLVLDNIVIGSTVTHWKNLPYGEFIGVSESVKNIEHVARETDRIKVGNEVLAFDEAVTRWEKSILDLSLSNLDIDPDRVGKTKAYLQWALGQNSKVPYIASWLDGGERVGLSHSILSQPITDAYDQELRLLVETTQEITDALANRTKADKKRHLRGVYIPKIGRSLKGHEILSVALNVGTESNIRSLLLGEGWANPDKDSEININNPKLQAILDHMEKSDWQLAQLIWDKMDSLYPLLVEVHQKTTGRAPPKVKAVAIETKHGTFRGGYYPIKHDPNKNTTARLHRDTTDAETESLFSNFRSIQTAVNTGSTNERTKFYAPLRLDLDVVANHFQQTIHYITHHEPVRAINKIINDPRIERAIKTSLGPSEYAQLKPWLNGIAKDGREAPTRMWWDSAASRLRMGVTLTYMGAKVITWVSQLAGLSSAAAEVGVSNMMKGSRAVLGSPGTMKSAWDFAVDNSKVMRHRFQTQDRELMEVFNSVKGENTMRAMVRDTSMKLIAATQTYMVDLPTWHAAYIKGLDDWGDPKRAREYADFVVESVQGSGTPNNLAAIMQRTNGKLALSLTMFMTYFSAFWNFQRDLVRGGRSGIYSITDMAARGMFLYLIPTLFDMYVRGVFGGEEDEETKLQKFLIKAAIYPAAGLPVVRDVANSLATDFDYNVSPIQSVLGKGIPAAGSIFKKAFNDEKITKYEAKSLIFLLSSGLKVPATSQLWDAGEHIYEVVEEGEKLTLPQLIRGPDRNDN